MDPGEFIERIIGNEIGVVKDALSATPSLVEARDTYIGSTPLHFASHRGFTKIVEMLLEAGADVAARERASDTTPLHWAAEGGHPAVARLLVERDADLEAIDGWYALTPLGWATAVTRAPCFHEDKKATADYLMEEGSSIDLFTAIGLGDPDTVRTLASSDRRRLSRTLGFAGSEMDPLQFAVSRRMPEMVRLLIDLGADHAARTAWGLTPLALALKNEDDGMVDLLKSRGAAADLSSAMIYGDTLGMSAHLQASTSRELGLRNKLLFAAADGGLAEASMLLLRQGADPNTRMKHLAGELPSMVSPLHLAAGNGHDSATRVLLEFGARVSAGKENDTPTPLHLAAGNGHLETVRALLEYGAEVEAVEKGFGATPLGWAEHGRHEQIVELLREHPSARPA